MPKLTHSKSGPRCKLREVGRGRAGCRSGWQLSFLSLGPLEFRILFTVWSTPRVVSSCERMGQVKAPVIHIGQRSMPEEPEPEAPNIHVRRIYTGSPLSFYSPLCLSSLSGMISVLAFGSLAFLPFSLAFAGFSGASTSYSKRSSEIRPLDVSGAHAFMPPDFAAGDVRGPCPGTSQ